MRTREERKLRRRENRLLALCMAIILVWVICLALDITAHAACELPGVRTDEAVTGSIVWGALITAALVRLDTPPRRTKKERQARGGELTAGETKSDERRSLRSF